MSYEVEYTERARKCIRKLDPSVRKLIKAWIDKNLVGCDDPRIHGKGLTSNRSGQWRYCAGATKKEPSPFAVGMTLSGYGIYPAHSLIIPYPSMINN